MSTEEGGGGGSGGFRDNRFIREIVIPPDKLEYLKKVEKSKVTEVMKQNIIKKVSGGLCCLCRGIPKHKVIYRIEGAVIIEKYCENCIKRVYNEKSRYE